MRVLYDFFSSSRLLATPYIPVAVGVFARTLSWIKEGGIYVRGNSPDVDNYLLAGREIFNGQWPHLTNYRPTQILYPILLSPIAILNLPVSTYVFWLHQSLSVLLVLSAFYVGKHCVSSRYGFLAALLAALNLFAVSWFHWMLTETLFYSLVVFFIMISVSVWDKSIHHSKSAFLLWLFSGILLLSVKPEAIAIFGGSVTVLLWSLLARYTGSKKATGYVLISLLTASGLFYSAIRYHTPTRNRLFSHIHVAHGLWLSTRTGANPSGLEQDQAYRDLNKFLSTANISEGPNKIAQSHQAMSEEGFKIIHQKPLTYLSLVFKRITGLLFPMYFNPYPGLLHRLFDIVVGLFLVAGACLLWTRPGNQSAKGISIISLFMVGLVAIYLADGDLRFRIPIYFALSLVAPIGWWELIKLIAQRTKRVRETSALIPDPFVPVT